MGAAGHQACEIERALAPVAGEANVQRPRAGGADLCHSWQVLGVGRRTVTGYLKKDRLPPIVAIACRALARDKHLLAAHYVPARKISRRAGA
jgi:hypothetical protein